MKSTDNNIKQYFCIFFSLILKIFGFMLLWLQHVFYICLFFIEKCILSNKNSHMKLWQEKLALWDYLGIRSFCAICVRNQYLSGQQWSSYHIEKEKTNHNILSFPSKTWFRYIRVTARTKMAHASESSEDYLIKGRA